MFPWSWLLTKLPFLWFPLPTLNELMLEWEQAICDFGPWIIRSWTTDYATSLLAYRKSGNTTTDIATSNPNSVSATTLFFLSFLFLPCLFILLFSLLLQISKVVWSSLICICISFSVEYPIKMKAGNAPSLLLPIKARSVLSVFPIKIKLLIACLKQSNQIISLYKLQHISSWLPRPE